MSKGSLKVFLISTIVYLIGTIFLFPVLRYYIDNPDTYSYITISQKIARGDFTEAVNGYWSPLICLLLAIPIKFNADIILAFKILQLTIGLFALWQWILLVEKLIKKNFFRLLLSISAVPFMLSYAFLKLTPDLLLLAMALTYLNMVERETFFRQRNFGIIAGTMGALLYLSKSFGFLFFIIHFSLIIFYLAFRKQDIFPKRHLAKNYITALLTFFLISGVWIALISNKYHHFTISETVSFNLSKEVAPIPNEKIELPVYSAKMYQLFPPVNPTAICAWEDPGLVVKTTPLKILSSSSDFHRYLKVLQRNVLTIYYFDFRRQIGFFFIVVLLFFIFSKYRRHIFSFRFLVLLMTIVLFYGLYGLILVHDRYIWICTLLMILMIGHLIDSVEPARSLRVRSAFLILLLLLSMKRPLKELFFSEDVDSSFRELTSVVIHPFRQLEKTYEEDKDLLFATDSLCKLFVSEQRIASLKSEVSSRDNYAQSSFVAFKTGTKYFGQVKYSNFNQLEDSLRRYQINYVLYWRNDSLMGNTHDLWERIYSNEKISLQIFKPTL